MNFKGFSILAVTILVAIYICMFGTYSYINFSYPSFVNSFKQEIAKKAQVKHVSAPAIKDKTEDISRTHSELQSSQTGTSNESAVPASAGQAIGKIATRFITPYGANTSYGKVYLRNTSGASINIASLLSKKLSFKIEKNNKPQVLIVHTHTTESYMLNNRDYYTENDQSRRLDESKNIVEIGKVFEKRLRESGIAAVHDKTVHDYPSYSGSYSRAAETINKNLKAHPSIKIIIDIHRDAVSAGGRDKAKTLVDINGKKYAQVMLVMGSQTKSISGFPNWQENLSLAVKYQQQMEIKYPGLARAIALNSAKYNQNISKGSILLEVGTEANTLEEAKNGASAAADALAILLNTVK